MEFRNPEILLRQRLAQLKGNPVAAILFVLIGLVILIPVLALAVLGVVLFGLYQLVRIMTHGAPRPGAPPSAGTSAPGPVIDVEVTRRESHEPK